MAHGGARENAGRKSKAEEMGLKALLDECITPDDRRDLFTALKRMAKGRGAHKLDALKLLLAYLYGTPRQTVEHSGDANGAPLRIEVSYADYQPDAAAPASGADAGEA